MSNKCEDCGEEKAWVFFGLDGTTRVCDCKVDLSDAIEYPRGMSSYLDERIDDIREVLEVPDAK